MKVLSVEEKKSVADEADELCSILESQSARIKQLKKDSNTTLAEKSFYCISSDKNLIYRVRGKFNWYLKYSRQQEWVRREIAGAEATIATLGTYSGYLHPACIRASVAEKYTLYSAVEGQSFNHYFLRGCFFGVVQSKKTLLPVMENLGRCLGRLHTYKQHSDLEVLNPNTLSYLQSYLGDIRESNVLLEKIAQWVATQQDSCEEKAWIHGNVKSEDIFIQNGKICLIDFGTCGKGSPYEDLVNLCTYSMLFRTVPFAPWRTARHAMSALIKGYAKENDLDKACLYNYITRGICRYYLKNVVLHGGMSSISGMPVLKPQLERLLLQLVQKDYQPAFTGVRF